MCKIINSIFDRYGCHFLMTALILFSLTHGCSDAGVEEEHSTTSQISIENRAPHPNAGQPPPSSSKGLPPIKSDPTPDYSGNNYDPKKEDKLGRSERRIEERVNAVFSKEKQQSFENNINTAKTSFDKSMKEVNTSLENYSSKAKALNIDNSMTISTQAVGKSPSADIGYDIYGNPHFCQLIYDKNENFVTWFVLDKKIVDINKDPDRKFLTKEIGYDANGKPNRWEIIDESRAHNFSVKDNGDPGHRQILDEKGDVVGYLYVDTGLATKDKITHDFKTPKLSHWGDKLHKASNYEDYVLSELDKPHIQYKAERQSLADLGGVLLEFADANYSAGNVWEGDHLLKSAKEILDFSSDFNPDAQHGLDIYSIATGKNLTTGKELSSTDYALMASKLLISAPYTDSSAKNLGEMLKKSSGKLNSVNGRKVWGKILANIEKSDKLLQQFSKEPISTLGAITDDIVEQVGPKQARLVAEFAQQFVGQVPDDLPLVAKSMQNLKSQYSDDSVSVETLYEEAKRKERAYSRKDRDALPDEHISLQSDLITNDGIQIRTLLNKAAQAYDQYNNIPDRSDIKYAMELLVKADKKIGEVNREFGGVEHAPPGQQKQISRLIRSSEIIITNSIDIHEGRELRRQIAQESTQAVDYFNLKYKPSTNGDFYVTGPNGEVTSLDYVVADTAREVFPVISQNDTAHFIMSTLLQNAQAAISNSDLWMFDLNMENVHHLQAAASEDYRKGFVRRTVDIASGLAQLVALPIDSAEAIVGAVINYKETYLVLKYTILKYFDDLNNMSPTDQARRIGEMNGQIAAEVVAAAGIPLALTKAPKLLADVGKATSGITNKVYDGMKVVRNIKARNMRVAVNDVSSVMLNETDFYVTPTGTVIPSKAYRHVYSDASYINELYATGKIPFNKEGTYITFDKFDSAKEAKSKMQLPPHNTAEIRIEFDTLQITDNVQIPTGFQQTSNIPEPITNTYHDYGVGGATQAITNSPIVVDRIINLNTGEVMFHRLGK